VTAPVTYRTLVWGWREPPGRLARRDAERAAFGFESHPDRVVPSHGPGNALAARIKASAAASSPPNASAQKRRAAAFSVLLPWRARDVTAASPVLVSVPRNDWSLVAGLPRVRPAVRRNQAQ